MVSFNSSLQEWIQALELFGHANDSDVVTYASVISACQKVTRWVQRVVSGVGGGDCLFFKRAEIVVVC